MSSGAVIYWPVCKEALARGATLLIGASAVTYNPHFRYFSTPVPGDSEFGAVQIWPPKPALLLLDSFAPECRQTVLRSAASHEAEIWILRQVTKTSPLSVT
jgi:hypothetical protein